MTPNFFAYEYQKYTEFCADFKSAEIIGKKCTQKKLFAKNCWQLVVLKRTNSNFVLFLPITFLLANFLHFHNSFETSYSRCIPYSSHYPEEEQRGV